MTVIVALRQNDQLVIGGDRAASDGANNLLRLAAPKVWQKGPFLFGYAGTLEGRHLQYKFFPPPLKGDLEVFMQTEFLTALDEFYDKWKISREHAEASDGMTLIICVGEEIYEHSPDEMTMINYDADWLSIGAGSEYAYGSLHSTQNLSSPKVRVRKAVEAACEFHPGCSLPLDVLAMKIKVYE